ncbi:MAG: cytochrome c1, partial [Methylococcales bacterium]|nr:cytochrome c1 [Methylococcales bacterium]
MHANIDLSDNTSLKRGAEHYVTYCLGCHSAKHIRYLRIAEDFELNQDVVLKDIAPVGASIYDSMLSAMDKHDSNIWFGTVPPDLSLIARSRGSDWLYTYLKSFYRDDTKTHGTNN